MHDAMLPLFVVSFLRISGERLIVDFNYVNPVLQLSLIDSDREGSNTGRRIEHTELSRGEIPYASRH